MARIPFIWRLMRFMNRRVAMHNSPNLKRGELVLVLYHTGRKSGFPRATPLQYEEVEGDYYVASARGTLADWYRNVVANPRVEILVKGQRLPAQAEAVTDPEEIADFLEMRLLRHPRMMRAMLRMEGLHGRITQADLLRISKGKALVILRPFNPVKP
jgi:deazaflavin-dependent oxidoreductase (nitroreductase family)